MQLAAPAPARFTLDFPDLRPGTMLDSRHGLRVELPRLPDVTARGLSWVLESTSTRLVIRDELRVGPIRSSLTATLEVLEGARLRYTIAGRVAGREITPRIKLYSIVDARRGYLELRSAADPSERSSTFHTDGCRFIVDKVGPDGSANRGVHPIYQPGSPGYVAPPA
jgi:hypothetical protein